MITTFCTGGFAGVAAGVVAGAGVVVVAACGARADVSIGQAIKERIRKYRVALWDMSLTSLHAHTIRTL
jgi:outer membrane lipoprotein SlyB